MSKKTITEIKRIIAMIQSDIMAASVCIENIGLENTDRATKSKIKAAVNFNQKAMIGLTKLYESQD